MSMKRLAAGFAGGQPLTLRTLPWSLLAVAAYVFLAPNVDFVPGLPQWHDGQRLAQLALLAAALLAFAAPGAARGMADTWGLLSQRVRSALLTAFALGLISALLAPLPRWALLEWGLSWLLLIVALCVAAQRRQWGESLDRALVVLLLAMAAAYATSAGAVYVVMLLIGPVYGQIFDVRELYVSFSNVRFFGHIQTMVLPFLLLPAMWWCTTWTRRLLLWTVPAAWWMLAVGSGTRGTWAALLVGVVAVALCGGRVGRRWIKWQAGGLLCGLLCYAVFVMAIPKWLEDPVWFLHRAGDILSLSLRGVLWANALTFSAQHPLLGIGPMHYAYYATAVGAHPHSAVLQWLAEWGIPAALLLTGVCAAAGFAFAGHVRRAAGIAEGRPALVKIALLAALAGAAAQAMVDGVLVVPVSQTLLALLCGWAIALHLAAREARCGAVQRTILAAVTVIAAGVVAYGVAPEIGRIAERERAYLAASPPDIPLLPRFWAQGLINR